MLRRMALRSSRFIFLTLVLAALSLFVLAPSNSGQITPPAGSPAAASSVVEIPIDGEIEPILADYVVHGIDQAATDHAGLILITINTPGGLDTSMRAIIQAILRSPVPVVTYVYPTGSRAASAGFYILLSADIAAMSPGTETGAASPIMEIGGQVVQIDDTLRKKIVNDATAYLRSYSQQARAQCRAGHDRGHGCESVQRQRSAGRQADRYRHRVERRFAGATERPARLRVSMARPRNWSWPVRW